MFSNQCRFIVSSASRDYQILTSIFCCAIDSCLLPITVLQSILFCLNKVYVFQTAKKNVIERIIVNKKKSAFMSFKMSIKLKRTARKVHLSSSTWVFHRRLTHFLILVGATSLFHAFRLRGVFSIVRHSVCESMRRRVSRERTRRRALVLTLPGCEPCQGPPLRLSAMRKVDASGLSGL